jgi:hypothetical protein
MIDNRQPWQVTRSEFCQDPPRQIVAFGSSFILDAERTIQKYVQQGVDPREASEIAPCGYHHMVVVNALRSGENVAAEVLDDYPSLRGGFML